ncbi:unnamed protein product [Didymodactylos carnosus]|uniref:Uncharacterized protein n=1 Tax=Didymodactylos carnosus TaxID=1234261 RepID=A0A815GDW6_9BILA|nr:unnamed protein product [Didymodactylos carnosus]CAF1338264.1 unnamed protein product [Didymodactylos carnosus]CAF3608928.1 unnamed protein product [Didymodactylos carnosus]CAF4197148.1 unnamed protein product [Didymodactylos carnosus]
MNHLLIIGLIFYNQCFTTVYSILTIPVGIMLGNKFGNEFKRINPIARQFVLNKLERRYQYNITELNSDEYNDTVGMWTSLCNKLFNGTMAVICYSNYDEFNWLSGFSDTYHVPFIILGRYLPSLHYSSLVEHNITSKHYFVSLMPDLIPALIAFIRRYNLKEIYYIFDGIESCQRLKELMYIQTQKQSSVLNQLHINSRYLPNANDSYDLLHSIELSNTQSRIALGRYVVLDFNDFSTYRTMMDKIKHRGMTTNDYHYILLTLKAKLLDMTYFRYGGVNVTFFALPDSFNMDNKNDLQHCAIDNCTLNQTADLYLKNLKQANIIDNAQTYLPLEALLMADSWETFLRAINTMLNLNETRDSLRVFRQGRFYNGLTPGIDCNQLQPWLAGEIYLERLLNTTFQGLSGNVQFNQNGERENYTLDVYRVTRNDLPKKIGLFKAPSTLEVTDDTTYRVRMAFDNRTRLVTTIFDEPFLMLKKNRNDTLTEKSIPVGTILDASMVEGYCVDLAYVICHDKLKIPYKFRIETQYGNEVTKGKWDGMVGALVNRYADLAIAPLTINGAREKAVDFSKPFIDLGISIMIGKPEKQKPGVFSFMAPLSKEIWICVILSYVFVSGILFFVSRFSSYEWYFENENDIVPQNKFTIHNSLFFSFAAFMHQGVDLLPRSISGRVVTSAWWYFSLILVSSYTANLAAFLTVEKLVTPIENVEDLANHKEIRYGVVKGGSTMAFFNKSTLTTFKKMWNFMQQNKDDVFVSSNREGIEKVQKSKGKFAFLLESTVNEYINERYPCDTMRIGDNIDSKGYGIATPLGSDLREAINIAVLDLTEAGYLERLKQKWYYDRSECTNVGAKEQSLELNLVNVAGIFYILIIGLGLAMVIAFLEFLIKAKLDSKRLNLNIRDVMRRNLRISITGIDFDEKKIVNYWPLSQQQQQSSNSTPRRSLEQRNRTSTILSVPQEPSPTATLKETIDANTSDTDHISHV